MVPSVSYTCAMRSGRAFQEDGPEPGLDASEWHRPLPGPGCRAGAAAPLAHAAYGKYRQYLKYSGILRYPVKLYNLVQEG